MEIIEFKKSQKNVEGIKFEFRYIGKIDDTGPTTEEIDLKLDEFLEKENHNDMLINIKTLRTILNCYEESLLVISYKENQKSEYIGFTNGQMFIYEKREETPLKYRITCDSREIEYKDYNNEENSFVELLEGQISPQSLEIINYLSKLNNAKSDAMQRKLETIES